MVQVDELVEGCFTRTYSPIQKDYNECYVKLKWVARYALKSLVTVGILAGFVLGLSDQLFAQLPDYTTLNLDILAQIESGNRPGAVNKDEGSFGLFQISPIALKDFNQQVGSSLTMKDMLREEKNAHVAIWLLEVRIPQLLEHAKKPVTKRNLIIGYNCGVSCLDRPTLPKTTQNYLIKYRRLSGEKI